MNRIKEVRIRKITAALFEFHPRMRVRASLNDGQKTVILVERFMIGDTPVWLVESNQCTRIAREVDLEHLQPWTMNK